MNVDILKQQIKDKKLDNFYVFVGDEWAVQTIYIHKMAEISGKKLTYINSISDIYQKLVNPTFLQTSACYVVRDDNDILTNENLQNQLMSGLLKENILILILTYLDKRSKGYKVFEDKCIVFDKMSVDTLKKHIKLKVDLSDINCDRLIKICEQDYGRILLEIDKIKQLNGNSDEIFRKLVEDGTIYVPPEDAIFDLVDAILKKQVKKVYYLLENCYEIGEPSLVILTNLYNAVKQLLQVQSCNSDNVMETCGITYAQMKAAESRKNKYSIPELIAALKLIRNTEKGIKIGLIEDSIAIEYVIINML